MSAESTFLRRWIDAGIEAVARERERLDSINVFPVADSDTGTNLLLTLREGARAVARLDGASPHAETVAAFSRGALLGARGNSGVIASQYLTAFLAALPSPGGLEGMTGAHAAAALEAGCEAAYDSVGEPVEGTILSVARAAADAAAAASSEGADASAALLAAVGQARIELARTPDLLPEAGAAGVVDSGAAGLLLLLDALTGVVAGPEALATAGPLPWDVRARTGEHGHAAAHGRASGAYEVMFLARRRSVPDQGDPGAPGVTLKEALREWGDSVAITGLGDIWQAHVHTDHPAQVVDVALKAGATQAGVTHIAATHGPPPRRAVLALTACPGLAPELASAGAVVIVVPEPAHVDLDEAARLAREVSTESLVVVAGHPLLTGVARAVAAAAERSVEPVPAGSEPQLIAALAQYALDPAAPDAAESMATAAARCSATSSSADALESDLERLVTEETDFVVVVLGRGVPPGIVAEAVSALAASHPRAEVQVYHGGQESPGVIIGVEDPWRL